MKNLIMTLVLVFGVLSCTITPKKQQTLLEQAQKFTTGKGLADGLLRIYRTDGSFVCTAFVIDDTTAVTAQHCMGGFYENQVILLNNEAETYGQFFAANGRSDIAMISGNFKAFKKYTVETDPEKDALVNKNKMNLVACGYPYGGKGVCYQMTELDKGIDMIKGTGQMYAGMSGGPVVDLNSGKVVGVNHAVGVGYVVIAPTVNMFDSMRIIVNE